MSKNKIGTCIYCHQVVALSGEHYLPRCVGRFRGFSMLRDRICKECNRGFGQFEEQFCRSGPEAFYRHLSPLKGRHRQHIDPFRRGSAGNEPMELQATIPNQDFHGLFAIHKDGKTGELLPHLIVDVKSTTYYIRITDDMSDHAQLRAKFEDLGIKFAESVKVIAPAPDVERIQKLLSGFEMQRKFEWSDLSADGTFRGGMIKLNITGDYFRALAKIGFHYFLKHNDRYRGDEDAFAEIRAFIAEGRGEFSQFVRTDNDITLGAQELFGLAPGSFTHILTAQVTDRLIFSQLQFFHRHDIRPHVHTIFLGKNPSKIIFKPAFGHSFELYFDGERNGWDGEMRVAQPVSASFIRKMYPQAFRT